MWPPAVAGEQDRGRGGRGGGGVAVAGGRAGGSFNNPPPRLFVTSFMV